jgi:nucleoside permease NupC
VIKPFIALLTMSECTFPGLASSSWMSSDTAHTAHTTHMTHTRLTHDTPRLAVHSVMASGFATVAGGVMVAYMSFGISPVHLIR